MNTCKNCKHFIFENLAPSRQAEIKKGWGFCSCPDILTINNHWHNPEEKNPKRDSIFTDTLNIGYLSEHHKQQGVKGIFIVGENFGCIHFKK